ncbi:hypothetical protein GGP62_002165 [Salinibacter ruber]|uniref:tail fiber domain-containing protein n=1 Tax=Salinibacter ruber TaxID=146919 RepID=UPI00216994D3|nr:tail fiber domain-containing protein [Salinibacter ruber]MCS3707178.1 hypothetical protein [Salinibacter ruber]
MANFGSKYTLSWVTPTADCRLWIKQEGYTGGSTALDPAPTPVSIRWGEQGRDDLTSPLRISTARIRFIGDSDGEMVEEIFDGGDTEYQVKFWRDPERDGSYELEWEGYLATDLWRDNPHLPAEVVELEAIDGLALLENREAYTSQDPSSGEWSLYDPSLALSKILRGWTPEGGDAIPMHDLPITTSQNWRPDGLDVGNDQEAQPLDKMDLYNTAFQELDDQEEVEETLDQRTQLEGILERFGLTLMLSGGEWRLRQRDQIGDGTSLKQWTMPTDQYVFGYSYTEDVTTDLPAVARTEKPRSRASRLQTLTSRYTYQDLGELVADGSFEDGFGAWTEVDSNATRVDYTDSPLATNSTQEDSFAVKMDYAFEKEEEQPRIHLRQELNAALQVAGPRGSYQFQYDEWVETGTSVIGAVVGGQYELATERVAVASEARAADDGTLIVDPIPGSPDTVVIPAGAVLPIDQPAPGDEVGYITLSEPAFGEDERLQGDISRNVKTDWKLKVYKWAPSTSGPSGVKGPRVLPAGEYQSAVQKIIVPQTTPQGDSVVGSMTVEMGTRDTANGNPTVWVDHVSVQVAVQGEPIEETNYQLAGAEYGREQTLSHRIGDGPTKGHPRGLFEEYNTAVFRHWAAGPGQGKTGKLLEQLLVEQWMRQQRDTLDRRTYECELRGSDSLNPHHVVGFDSKTYTVSFLERSYGTPGDSARVEMTELKDAGLAGLERTYSMNSSDSPGGGGSGGGGGFGGGSSGGNGGSSTWDQLDGKPSGLFASNGDGDGFAETQALGNADITGALDLSSSTFLEVGGSDKLAARVKDEDDFASDSDTHLATQQSIKAYAQLANLGDVDLSASDDGVQAKDLLAYNGSEWTDKDPSDIKVGNADLLDGYEASAFTRKAEDATITGQWLYNNRTDFAEEVRHPDWNAGLSHWGIEPNGEADFRLIEADELRVEAFTADVTQSLAGSDVLTKSAADLASGFTVPDPADGFITDALHIEDIGEVGAQAAFENGDTIRLRIVDRSGGGLEVLDVWGTVQNYTDTGDGSQKWDFQTADGTESAAYGRTIHKGSRVLDYGTEGDPIIERSVTGIKSPFDRTVRWFDDNADGVPDRFETDTQTGRIDALPDVSTTEPGFFGSAVRLTDDILAGDLTKQDDYLEYISGELTVDGRVFMREGFIEESVTVGGTGIWPSQLPGNLISLWAGSSDTDRIQGETPEGRTSSGDQVYPGEEGRISTNYSNYIRVDRGGAHGNGSLFISDDEFINELDDGGFESGNDTQGNRTGLSATATNRATGSTSVIQTSEARSGDYAVEMVKDYDPTGADPGSTENSITYSLSGLPYNASDYAGTVAVKPMDLSSIGSLRLEVSMDGEPETLHFDVDRGEWQVLPFLISGSQGSSATLTVTWPGSEDNAGRLLVDELAIYANKGINTAAETGAPFDAGTQGPPTSLIYPTDLKGDFTVGMFLREWTGTDGGGSVMLSGPDSSTDFMTVYKLGGKTWSLGTAVGPSETKDVADFPEPDDQFHEYWVFLTREGDTVKAKAILSDRQVVELSASGPGVSEMDFTEIVPSSSGSSTFVDHVLVADKAYSTADCERVVSAGAPLAPGGTGLGTEAAQSGLTIRSDSEPSERPSGGPLQAGDMWLDTDDGDKPYTWDGSMWIQAYTSIDGGNIDTGTVDAQRIDANQTLTESLLANNAEITAELEMGTLAKIVTGKDNTPSDNAYEITDDGIYVADTEEIVFGPNKADGSIDKTLENRTGSMDVIALDAPSDAPENNTEFFSMRGDKGTMLRARGLGNNVSVYEAGYTEFGVAINATDDIEMVPDKYGNTGSGVVRLEGNLNYTGSLNSVSDRRVKASITSLGNPLETACQLSGKTYTKGGDREAGFIAQDVEGIFDVAVSEIGELKALSYQSFHALWAESIKELKAENDRLRERISQLESQI